MVDGWQRPWARVGRWLAAAAWMGLIFFLSAQSTLPRPSVGWAADLVGSASHAAEFCVLAVLLARALDRQPRPALLAFVLAAFYALSDEFHQSFVPGRTPDAWDVACDAAGALLGLALWTWWRRRGRR